MLFPTSNARSVVYLSHAFQNVIRLTGYFHQKTRGQLHIFHTRFGIKQDSNPIFNRKCLISHIFFLLILESSRAHKLFQIENAQSVKHFSTDFENKQNSQTIFPTKNH